MKNSKRAKGTIAFRLKNSTSEEKPIRLDYSYGRGKRFRYSIGYSVNPEYWNETGKVKNVNAVRNSDYINKLIRDLETKLEDFVSDCDSKQIEITNPIMKEHLDEFLNKIEKIDSEKEKVKVDLLSFIKKHIEQKKKELPKAKNGNKNNTVKSYEQTLSHLKSFQNEVGFVVDFRTIDSEFYSEFIEYMNLKTYTYNKKQRHYSLNTIGKHIKNLKVFMGASLDQELHTNLKYKKFKPLVEITTAIYLELEELKSIYELDLSDKPHYQLARDVFVIGCEMGQRISDYHDLMEQSIVEHQNERYIRVKQEKTKKEVLCKVTPVIEKIMNDRYGGQLPPKIAEQKLNDYIKIVGKEAKINTPIKNEITRGGKRIIEYVPKCDLIMGHSARRTFCTLKYKAGMPVHSIMELSGHSTLKEFMKYIRNPKEERVSQITSSEAFKESCLAV
ncbi:phage integrase SAM-like domain-containing protein [Mariniflexile sp. HNIBRBA6329]|uniref:phage integrase SAM-like domain-containing protein n=1 Tax=Mariniflexile sp. HNIBRBA6329 TaxID=3373088 RepID=UPI0037477E9C